VTKAGGWKTSKRVGWAFLAVRCVDWLRRRKNAGDSEVACHTLCSVSLTPHPSIYIVSTLPSPPPKARRIGGFTDCRYLSISAFSDPHPLRSLRGRVGLYERPVPARLSCGGKLRRSKEENILPKLKRNKLMEAVPQSDPAVVKWLRVNCLDCKYMQYIRLIFIYIYIYTVLSILHSDLFSNFTSSLVQSSPTLPPLHSHLKSQHHCCQVILTGQIIEAQPHGCIPS